MGCVAASAPVPAEEPGKTWEYSGCLGESDGPSLGFLPTEYGLGGGDIDVILLGRTEFVAAPPRLSPTIPYTAPLHEDIDGTVTLEIERSSTFSEEEMRWILDSLGRDPEAASEPVRSPVVLDVSGSAQTTGGFSTDMDPHSGWFLFHGASPLPGEGVTEFYGTYAVTTARFELDIPHGGTCVIEGTSSPDDPIAKFSTIPSQDEQDAIEAAAANEKQPLALAVTAVIVLLALLYISKPALSKLRKKRTADTAGPQEHDAAAPAAPEVRNPRGEQREDTPES